MEILQINIIVYNIMYVLRSPESFDKKKKAL